MWEIEAEAETLKGLTVVEDGGGRGGLRRRLGIIFKFKVFVIWSGFGKVVKRICM